MIPHAISRRSGAADRTRSIGTARAPDLTRSVGLVRGAERTRFLGTARGHEPIRSAGVARPAEIARSAGPTRGGLLGRAACAAALLLFALAFAAPAHAQLEPYRSAGGWGELPDGREWGAVTGVFPADDGGLWVMERCGGQSCADRPDVDPILKLDGEGRVERSFGAGLFSWPHGFFVDAEGHVWATDAEGFQGRSDDGLGHVVYEFDSTGELLRTFGEPGVPGSDERHFDQPNDVVVGPEGRIFVADGHGNDGNNRVVVFEADGTYAYEWGGTGREPGRFHEPHTVALDSRGRLFVGDRGNNRIQIFTRDGEFLEAWTQFGRPSGIFITPDDVILVADSDSNPSRRLRGWKRGIRIGHVRDGRVRALIPDPEHDPEEAYTSGAEFVAMDADGVVWGAEIGPRTLRKYVPLFDPFAP